MPDARMADYLAMINDGLDAALSPAAFSGEDSAGLSEMLKAMRYSVADGGKRIRPVLTLEFCRLCGGDPRDALPFALAVEMVHTYSLIHDDLPCMDDDALRRGKPSSHIVFGEANALLAGDALLTFAFETALSAPVDPAIKAEAALLLAKAAGCAGMIAGQVMDLQNEGRRASLVDVRETDRRKTGAMIRAAAEIGCVAAGGSAAQRKAAVDYAQALGLAFQIVDDILDVTGDAATLGKPIGSDNDNQKSTYVSLLGLAQSQALADDLTRQAEDALSIFGSECAFLKALAARLAARTN
ncbi:MAG: polyprenyl synthetase family protein [Clostridia bacterium]|nr:polyprenyl synthetase family protein [Clostridia bacterium]